jgi:hypothetical protein
MARQPNVTDQKFSTYLKELVRIKSGLSCNSFSDIRQLQVQIKLIAGEILSLQTLNRFFGLIKNDFHCSKVTLDIICLYVNYDSLSEFTNACDEPLGNLLKKEQATKMLAIMFTGINPEGGIEMSLCKLCLNIYKCIDKKEIPENDAYAALAGTELGRKYIFETCVYVDKLNGHFGAGLNFYILQSKKPKEFLFANSVLCLRSFLNADARAFEIHFKKITNTTPDEIRDFSPIVIARYGAALILNEILNSSTKPITEKVAAIITLITTKTDDKLQANLACTILAEALLLAGVHDEVLRILNLSKSGFDAANERSKHPELSHQHIILKLYAGFCSKNNYRLNMQERISSINDNRFHELSNDFLSNDFYSILITQLIILTGKRKDSKIAKNHLGRLVTQTGFNFFREPVQQMAFV